MGKKLSFLLVSAFGCFCLLFNLTSCNYITLIENQKATNETFLETSVSPDGNYKLEAYRTEPGATVDFSIKVYSVKGSEKRQIYNCYHESTVSIHWIDNDTVKINNICLDLSENETYDWRRSS